MAEILWHNIQLTVSEEDEEIISALLSELGTLGIVSDESSSPTLTAYFSLDVDLKKVQQELTEQLEKSHITPNFETRTVPEEDWESSWREKFSPIAVGKRFIVHPPWMLPPEEEKERLPVIINPKMAFGTGSHATTMLCMAALEEIVYSGCTVLDVGAGSGILSIAAAKLGAGLVSAVEIDPVAAKCGMENIELNGVAGLVSMTVGGVEAIPEPRYDIIASNIQAEPLSKIAADLRQRITPGGSAIMSGVLKREEDSFLDCLREAGWHVEKVTEQYDEMISHSWIVVHLRP